MQEVICGLHSCKPENKPIVGETKTFVVEHKPARNGKKPWIKIRSAGPDYGGEPYRILSAEPTGFTDTHGNISFNIEIEPAQNLSGESSDACSGSTTGASHAAPAQKRFGAVAGENIKSVREASAPSQSSNGVEEARKHLMQSANLMLLAIKATMYVGDQAPEALRTEERYGAILGQLFKEASNKRTDDGVNWYSYVDKMPTHPIK